MSRTIGRIPGALMIVPLLTGAVLNTVDRLHLGPVQVAMRWLGAPPAGETSGGEPYSKALRIGGFATALTGPAAVTLIAAFLVCVASQMDFGVDARSLKKGVTITLTKLGVAIACGSLLAATSDPFDGWLGLSTVAVVAAMPNGNGGLYLALTGQYGDRSDVGAVSVVSLNDGPFFTLMALGLMGEKFPAAAFLGVLLPMAVGFLLGRFSPEARRFLKPGERLCIPFFAFVLGTTLDFGVFLDGAVLAGGLVLAVATVLLTGSAAALALRLVGERTVIAGWAEASTAGNAVQTPLAVAVAAGAAAAAPDYQAIVPTATAQISISTIATAILCPLLVTLWARRTAVPAAAVPFVD